MGIDGVVQNIFASILLNFPSPLLITTASIALVFTFGTWSLFKLVKKQNIFLNEIQQLTSGIRGESVKQIISDFEKTIKIGNESVNTFAIVDKSYVKNVSGCRIFNTRKTIDLERMLSLCINSLIILGLVGTFLGLSQSLFEIKGTLASLESSNQSGQTGNILNNIIASLSEPLSKMSTAFIASLLGISLSLVLNILVQLNNIPKNKEQIFNELEDYLENLYLPKIKKNTITSLLENQNTVMQNFLTHFSYQIEQGFHKAIDRLGENISGVSTEIRNTMAGFSDFVDGKFSVYIEEIGNQSIRTMSKVDLVINELGLVVNEFKTGAKYLESVGQRFEGYVETMSDSTQQLGQEIGYLEKSIRDLGEGVTELADESNNIGAELQKIGQDVENTMYYVKGSQQEIAEYTITKHEEQNKKILQLFEQMEAKSIHYFNKRVSLLMEECTKLLIDLADKFEKNIEDMNQSVVDIHEGSQHRIINAVAGLHMETASDINKIYNEVVDSFSKLTMAMEQSLGKSEHSINRWANGLNNVLSQAISILELSQQGIQELEGNIRTLNKETIPTLSQKVDNMTNNTDSFSDAMQLNASQLNNQLNKLSNNFEMVNQISIQSADKVSSSINNITSKIESSQDLQKELKTIQEQINLLVTLINKRNSTGLDSGSGVA